MVALSDLVQGKVHGSARASAKTPELLVMSIYMVGTHDPGRIPVAVDFYRLICAFEIHSVISGCPLYPVCPTPVLRCKGFVQNIRANSRLKITETKKKNKTLA